MCQRIGLFHVRDHRDLCRDRWQREHGRVRIAVEADGASPQGAQDDVLGKGLACIEHVRPDGTGLQRTFADGQKALALSDVHGHGDHLGVAGEPGYGAERGRIARMGEHHPLL